MVDRQGSVERQILACIERRGRDIPGSLLLRLARLPRHQMTRGAVGLLNNILDHLFEYGVSGRSDTADTDDAQSESTRDFVKAADLAASRISTMEFDGARFLAGIISFIALNVELLCRRFEPPDFSAQQKSDEFCRELLERSEIRDAIYAIYAPPRRAGGGESAAESEWARLDPATFKYYKAGTTSAILTAGYRDSDQRASDQWVLKCVLFPWNKMSAVAKATESYAATYGSARRAPSVVQPVASTSRWVLMPRQDGDTLRERINKLWEHRDVPPGQAVAEAKRVARALVVALRLLADSAEQPDDQGARPPEHGRFRQHLDLSPSNVILAPDGPAKLIDLGRNHLYSRQVGIAEHDDSVYVAPEVKNRGAAGTSDVYSLGVILTEILSGSPPRDGRVPDSIYEMSPALGRALDDLLEEDPHRRLLLAPRSDGTVYDRVSLLLEAAFAQVEAEPVVDPSRVWRTYARFAASSRELPSQFRKWREVRKRGGDEAYLLFFSLVATLAWWGVFARVAVPQVPDFIKDFPKLPAMPEAAKLIAFAQAMVAAKYYQTILARLTTRHLDGWLARAAEVSMRLMTVVALPTTVIAVSWQPRLWAWSCAAGAVLVACNNLLILLTARKLFAAGRAAGFSTVPPPDHQFPRGFEQWWWTMLLYGLVIGVIAAGLQGGWMKDESAYVFGLLLINIGIHYIAKCAMAGPSVRGGLARSILAGERLAAGGAPDLRPSHPSVLRLIPGRRTAVEQKQAGAAP
ncbi:protein kinase domain-containing protein [Micromonospora chersina]|uniref:protein kinase domain-containing protein n=1 Tax=Micromonospora chersina TaxID=47854 RepID=UPI0037110C7F